MNDYIQKMDLQAAVRPRFHGHDTLNCKTLPRFPESAEREYIRMSNDFMRLVNEVVKKHMPRGIRRIRLDSEDDSGELDRASMLAFIDAAFLDMEQELADRITKYGLRKKLESFAHMTRKLTIREWKRAVKATLGIDIMEDYYNGEFFKRAMEEWIDHNIGLIVTIPQASLGEMKNIVREGFMTGKRTKDITKEIQDTYHRSKRHAHLLARDQTAKLNGQLTQAQHRDAGVREYIWSTCRDSRVRDGHRRLHGKKFSYDDPPVVDPRTGRRCNPMEDYQCRCTALPVFNMEGMELPWENGLDDFATKGYRSIDIPRSEAGLHELAQKLGVPTVGTDTNIQRQIMSKLKKQGWKYL